MSLTQAEQNNLLMPHVYRLPPVCYHRGHLSKTGACASNIYLFSVHPQSRQVGWLAGMFLPSLSCRELPDAVHLLLSILLSRSLRHLCFLFSSALDIPYTCGLKEPERQHRIVKASSLHVTVPSSIPSTLYGLLGTFRSDP